jgi:hypothetical protein
MRPKAHFSLCQKMAGMIPFGIRRPPSDHASHESAYRRSQEPLFLFRIRRSRIVQCRAFLLGRLSCARRHSPHASWRNLDSQALWCFSSNLRETFSHMILISVLQCGALCTPPQTCPNSSAVIPKGKVLFRPNTSTHHLSLPRPALHPFWYWNGEKIEAVFHCLYKGLSEFELV